ncbi:MAG TPA: DUF5615 family PIN-like protein [Syntrophobacteraceae bacterium]|nr:DUF5615 family PIN-like protein [Syntrophobacteraceae bacterium]
MWLLDVNMPRQLRALLADLGITAETANARGWGTLVNGDLLEAASASGFECLLTRDRLFGQSVSRHLKRYPNFAIVLVLLPQVRAPQFLASFKAAWEKTPIAPTPGQVQSWP